MCGVVQLATNIRELITTVLDVTLRVLQVQALGAHESAFDDAGQELRR
jgi:hypothetical protein